MQTSLDARLNDNGVKRILSLDGGGIRGVYTLRILARIEALLRAHYGDHALVLADWFHFIGGTSTGAIIATALALGFDVATIERLYRRAASAIFQRSAWWQRVWHLYESAALERLLRETYGEWTTLGDARLRTLLLITLHNLSTDSAWTLTNHPRAEYNDTRRANCNLALPLWQIVRAATAAPAFFRAHELQLGTRRFRFEDGALTPWNNPSFQMFLTATAAPYRVQWSTGAGRMLLLSVGTGECDAARPHTGWLGRHIVEVAASSPHVLINGASAQQDLLCRVFGECRFGLPIDRECGDMLGAPAPGAAKLFSYARYNAPIDEAALRACAIDAKLGALQRIDAVRHIDELATLGQRTALTQVQTAHWHGFLDTP